MLDFRGKAMKKSVVAISLPVLIALFATGISKVGAGSMSRVTPQESREDEIVRLISDLRDTRVRQDDPERLIKAIERLGDLKATAAIDDLIQLIGFRRTFSWERNDGFVVERQPITPGNRYPAVSALFQIGKPALPALVQVIEGSESNSIESTNATYAVQSIFRENLPEGVKYLRHAAKQSFTVLMGQRLSTAARRIEALSRKVERSK
jgi:hypothetical protein